MLGQRRRRWANVKTILGLCFVSAWDEWRNEHALASLLYCEPSLISGILAVIFLIFNIKQIYLYFINNQEIIIYVSFPPFSKQQFKIIMNHFLPILCLYIFFQTWMAD